MSRQTHGQRQVLRDFLQGRNAGRAPGKRRALAWALVIAAIAGLGAALLRGVREVFA